MANKAIKTIKLTNNLSMSECKDGYWLYDYTRGMNLSMREKTEDAAFVEAITYYQKRTKKLEAELKKLNQSIDVFIESIKSEEDH